MRLPRRRAVLLAASVLGWMVGCLGDGRNARGARIPWIWIVNDRPTGQSVRVGIDESGDRVFETTVRLGPRTAESGTTLVEKPVAGPGAYVCWAETGTSRREIDVLDLVDGTERCVGIRFSLLDNGGMDWWHRSMEQC